MQHLAKVNGWTQKQTEEYVAAQFDVWQLRSKYEWKLDVRWLGQFGIQVKGSILSDE